ncbi:unnamed protein product [Prorocentrum cordatum]|uniref:Uncharacterized protein n=1 Tax=Prorocentrum cordatum TaxID=2364126 RepID=A0ABN9T1Q6_9DINO|nr:unnamed protein product [Polarella glacialis]
MFFPGRWVRGCSRAREEGGGRREEGRKEEEEEKEEEEAASPGRAVPTTGIGAQRRSAQLVTWRREIRVQVQTAIRQRWAEEINCHSLQIPLIADSCKCRLPTSYADD